MLLERYEYKSRKSYRQFDFYSKGPKGKIRKVVLYTFLRRIDGIDYYNLGFGDYDEGKKKVNDLSVSDNKDRDKILATVAMTALEFTSHYDECRIVFEGSTPARTRLYQMGIAKYYKGISELFDIQGLTEKDGWRPFRVGDNYMAFLASRK
jgi:hypothetical protein